MKKIYLLLATFFLILSCNDAKLEKEILQLKKQNDILKKQTPDSLSIYNAIRENRNQQLAENFVDSLRKSNPKLLEKIDKEIMFLRWNRDIEYTE